VEAGLHAGPYTAPELRSAAWDEIDRLQALGLHKMAAQVAKEAGPRPAWPSGRFDLGTVFCDTGAVVVVGHEGIWADLQRFVTGDLGESGHVDQVELTDAIRWCPVLAPHPTAQAAAAIADGRGVIVARYDHGPVTEANRRPARRTVDIACVLDPAGSITLISSGSLMGLARS
jgi:hypothetical protein